MRLSYWSLIRDNVPYRNLWYAQMISLMGDWFNMVALMGFVSNPKASGITDSGIYISLVLVCSFLPQFIIGPFAGIVVDRLNRKTILIISDILRGFFVLGFLFVNPSTIWLLYTLEILINSTSAFFMSSKAAILPGISRSSHELVQANAMGQTTWGLMLSVGGLLAGLVVSVYGFQTAFIINSVTYFVSAYFVRRIAIANPYGEANHSHRAKGFTASFRNTWLDFRKGVSYILKDRFITALLLVKPGWAIGGGAILTLYTVFAKDVFKVGDEGIGILFMSRGIGVLLGSLLGSLVLSRLKQLNILIIIALIFGLYGVFYGAFSMMTSFFLAAVMIVIATIFSSNLWLFSRTTLQEIVPNELRGRVFAHDEGLSELFMMFSALGAGWALNSVASPRDIAFTAAISMIVAGVILFISVITKLIPSHPESRAHDKPH